MISDYDVTEKMLQYFIKKTCGGSRFFKPRLVVCVPSGVTEVEKRAVKEAALQAGGRAVYLIEEPVAAAIGAGIDINAPEGIMIIDIGGGTTDIAVISMGGIVSSASVKVAGDRFDDCIVKYMRKKYSLFIGERTAEKLKREVGMAFADEEPLKTLCKGRDLVTGLPRTVEVGSEEVLEALEEPLDVICEATHSVLGKDAAGACGRRRRNGHRDNGRRGISERPRTNAYRSGPGSGQSWRQTRICASPEEQENHLNI